VHRVTILDAVEQGLVERIKRLKAPNPTARREWLEELRASVPDEETWKEEYLCQPASGNSALLSYELIAACEAAAAADLNSISNLESEIPNPATFYAGFDVGRKHDRSCLWVLERVGDVYWTRTVRVLEQTPFTDQENLLHALMQDRAVRRLCVDSTGIGAMLAERLVQRWGHRVEAVNFSAPVKSDLAMPLVRLFQDRRVRVPSDPAIREDLHRVRKSVTTAGNIRFEAERTDDGHADRFWALALAFHGADDNRLRLPPPLLRKPVGW
jgi:phage FluMu gp28-like protein